MPRPIRLVLVEDNDHFREALELLLSLREDLEVVGSVDNGNAAAALVGELEPDVVVMDYRLPGLNGVEATRAIRGACPAVAVVCLTASVTPHEVEELYAAGVRRCLTKDEELERIVDAIHEAAARWS